MKFGRAPALHCRLRYFDPARRRAGLPEDVAALVEKLSADEVTVTLVNLSPLHERTVTVQGGAYAEHQLQSVTINGNTTPLDSPHFSVRLASRRGSRIGSYRAICSCCCVPCRAAMKRSCSPAGGPALAWCPRP